MVVFEGILAFCHAPLLELMDLKIFVDTDSDIRLARRCVLPWQYYPVSVCVCSPLRLRRDISERGRDLEGVLKQYNKFVKPVSPVLADVLPYYEYMSVPAGLPPVHSAHNAVRRHRGAARRAEQSGRPAHCGARQGPAEAGDLPRASAVADGWVAYCSPI